MSIELFKTPLASDSSLKALYRFESGALTTDSSGNGLTLTNHNSISENSNGKFGYCADLGSSDSDRYFDVADNFGYAGGAISISFWIKLNTEISSSQYNFVEIYENTAHTTIFVIYEYNSGTRRLYFQRVKQGVAIDGFSYNITLGTSNWVHIALTYSGSTIIGYVNGSNIGNASSTGNGTFPLSPLINIGGSGATYSSLTLIDDVCFFNRVLTSEEILSIYQGDGWQVTTNYLTNYRPRRRTPGAVSV